MNQSLVLLDSLYCIQDFILCWTSMFLHVYECRAGDLGLIEGSSVLCMHMHFMLEIYWLVKGHMLLISYFPPKIH